MLCCITYISASIPHSAPVLNPVLRAPPVNDTLLKPVFVFNRSPPA